MERTIAHVVGVIESTVRPDVGRILDRERSLWTLVVVTLVLDVVLTALGRQIGLVEANPLVDSLLVQYGPAALIVLKIVALAAGICARRAVPTRYAASVPLGLALPWGVAVVANALAISVAVW